MTWYKLVSRLKGGIEKLVMEEQRSPLDLEDYKPVLPMIIQLYETHSEVLGNRVSGTSLNISEVV
ncbi:MAG: hypothetical protein ABIE94_02135 [archaeon]